MSFYAESEDSCNQKFTIAVVPSGATLVVAFPDVKRQRNMKILLFFFFLRNCHFFTREDDASRQGSCILVQLLEIGIKILRPCVLTQGTLLI